MASQIDLDVLNASAGIGDAWFFQYLSPHGTGTGTYETFLRVKAQGNNTTEAGFNTDADVNGNPGILDDMPSHQFTHSLDFATMQAVSTAPDGTDLGQDYVVFRLDLGEQGTGQNPDAHITLTEFKVFQNGNPSPTTIPTGALVYDLDAGGDKQVLLNDFSSGNGQSDYLIYVPKDNFSTDPAVKYVTVYANFSGVDSTFEEFGYIRVNDVDEPGHPSIAIVKTIAGFDVDIDGDGADVGATDDPPVIIEGKTVEYSFAVTNDGDVDLSDIVLTDTPALAMSGPSGDDGDNILNVGETWTYTATSVSVADGPHYDTATVTGTSEEDGDATASDSSGYFGATVGITVLKEVSIDGGATWSDANDETGPTLLGGNDDPEWRITVTNSGNVALEGVSLSDVLDGSDFDLGDDSIFDLAASGEEGDTKVVTFTDTWSADQHTNTATGVWSFTDDAGNTGGNPDGVSDSANYFGAVAALHIEKTANGVESSNVFVGQPVTFNYTVTNDPSANVESTVSHLTGVKDDNGTVGTGDDFYATYVDGDVGDDNILGAGEEWHFTATKTATVADTVTNTGTVTGSYTDDAGNTAAPSDDDTASYTGHNMATLGLSKGYWANHAGTGPGNQANAWDDAADQNLIIGDGDPNGGSTDFSIERAGAVAATNTNTTGDARLIFIGQANAAQLNAYAAGENDDGDLITANGLLDSAADWLNAYGGQDDNNVVNPGEYAINKNSFSFLEGSKVSTSTSGGAWKGEFISHTYDSNEDGGDSHTVSVTGEGLKNILEAYDLASHGEGLVVSDDGSLVGWWDGGVVSHVYDNTPNAFIAVVNEAECDGLVSLAGVTDSDNTYLY